MMPIQTCTTLDGLNAIHQPDCSAVILDRDPPETALRWLSQLAPDQLPSTRIVVPPTAVKAELEQLTSSLAHGPERDWLINDIANLSFAFAQLMQAPYVRLRLDVVTTNACRKFHIDAVTARLVCTYRGQTTEFGLADAGEVPAIVAAPAPACPVILRGSRWPNTAPSNLRHRSPPIAGSGESRLLLVLDPMDTPEEQD